MHKAVVMTIADSLLFRKQEVINKGKEDIDKQRKLLMKKRPKTNSEFTVPGTPGQSTQPQ